MLVIRFGPGDLANLRFAISPLLELHRSVRVLNDPGARSTHLPWITAARSCCGDLDLDLDLLRALAPRDAYAPDFVHPPPSSPLTELEDELEVMLATPADQIRAEIKFAYRRRAIPAVLNPMLAEPDLAAARLADIIRTYWQRALADHWERIRNLLQGDILYRARQIADGGANLLFDDLHHDAHFENGELRIEPWAATRDLDGRGLLLVPSVFVGPLLTTITKSSWQPTLIYPARGVGMLWERGKPAAAKSLIALLGRRRAAVLAALDAPRSTTELAYRLGLSTASVSQHLAVLRNAGLASDHRVGRVVLYLRTDTGERLANATNSSSPLTV